MLARILILAALLGASSAHAQLRWQEGVHYTAVPGAQTAGAPAGRIEVAEVFSYACGACYQAAAPVEKIKASLPADAAMVYLHAGFNNGWKVVQRAYVTAQLLGIADATHARVFAGIWETGDYPLLDRATGNVRQPALTIQDAARFYARNSNVSEADFVKKAASREVEAGMARADELTKLWRVGGTPTFVVNGRYQIDNGKLTNWDDLQALITYLVGLERTRLKKP